MAEGVRQPVRVWDGAVRLVHWAIVVAFVVSWQSAEYGRMDVHVLSGSTMAALVVFRIVWGFVGSDTARFSRFVRGPAAVFAYARGLPQRRPSDWPGHNPLGALSVVAILGLLLIQVALGMFSVDTDAIESGPLAHLVSFGTGRTIAGLHGLVFDLLQILVVVHIAAVAYYLLVKRENLIGAMVSGAKRLPSGRVPTPRFASPWLALALFLVVAGLVWLLVTHPPR